ncbi:MAG: 16S rRNA (guanine(966)-N(2))-methyltransferase RsmD [Smithella sp.]|nr:16S rRNA (guanine(966)-N(2))-methyltransferase RsmD [Smithella sp.]
MRIIGGKAKGKIFHFPSGSSERPTSDFLRETLFNILGSVEKKTFLDLFAGSGSVGLEAASRGADKVYFVEKNAKLAAIIKKNIEDCRLEKNCLVNRGDVESFLREICRRQYKMDIIFTDPPYNRGMVDQTVTALKKYNVFHDKSLLVIQHSVRENFNEVPVDNMQITDRRKYGDTVLTFLEMEKK